MPQGAGVAVRAAPNIEHHEYLSPLGVVKPGDRRIQTLLSSRITNTGNASRMIAGLDEYDVRPMASLNAAVLEHYPEIANAMRGRDWEFISEGYGRITGRVAAAVKAAATAKGT